MPIELANFEDLAREAVKTFWNTRTGALQAQAVRGVVDQGERGSVTAGKNMDGFIELIHAVIVANGLAPNSIYKDRGLVALPGYYRPTKQWDLLVMHKGKLVAALELKSQIGPSFGNNFNNRCEESIGTATDLWVAFRENAFGESPRPFVGYLMLLEDCQEVHTPVRDASPHFPVLDTFKNVGYAQRYAILCDRLVKERLYDSAAVLLSPRDEGGTHGAYREMSAETGLRRFVSQLAGHIASITAM
jgi:Restriction endonuclease XhoI